MRPPPAPFYDQRYRPATTPALPILNIYPRIFETKRVWYSAGRQGWSALCVCACCDNPGHWGPLVKLRRRPLRSAVKVPESAGPAEKGLLVPRARPGFFIQNSATLIALPNDLNRARALPDVRWKYMNLKYENETSFAVVFGLFWIVAAWKLTHFY